MKPLAIDLFCGLGGWAEGLLAEGYDVIGFDIERHRYPEVVLPHTGAVKTRGRSFNATEGGAAVRSFNGGNAIVLRDAPPTGRWIAYPGQLVLQDVLTLHGSQFRDAALIVASPPCQAYSWMAMPWTRAKAKAAAIRGDETGQMLADLNKLFDACFRIAGQASLAAGRKIPLVVENVRGAQPWVGRARWNYGSYYLWGDVPALMPFTDSRRLKGGDVGWRGYYKPGYRAVTLQDHFATKAIPHRSTGHWTNPAEGMKTAGGSDRWFNDGPRMPDSLASSSSNSPRRKMASAMIARIPLPLARHIARTYRESVAG